MKTPQKRWDDRHLDIDSEGRLRTKLYAKRDDFDFPVVNLPFTCICRKNFSSICIWYVYLSDDTTSVLVLRKATTSNLTIYGLIQPTTELMINYVNHNIPDADNIYFLFQLQLKYNRDTPHPPVGFHAPIEVTTCTYIVFTNDLQMSIIIKLQG